MGSVAMAVLSPAALPATASATGSGLTCSARRGTAAAARVGRLSLRPPQRRRLPGAAGVRRPVLRQDRQLSQGGFAGEGYKRRRRRGAVGNLQRSGGDHERAGPRGGWPSGSSSCGWRRRWRNRSEGGPLSLSLSLSPLLVELAGRVLLELGVRVLSRGWSRVRLQPKYRPSWLSVLRTPSVPVFANLSRSLSRSLSPSLSLSPSPDPGQWERSSWSVRPAAMEPSAAAAAAAAPAPLEPWVWLFLQTEYYNSCATHEHINNKNTVCNHFCIDCVRPICQYCTSSGPHEGHRNLQIRRASKACSVDTASLSEFKIDVSGLHKFKINGFSIHFLVPRLPEGSKKKSPSMEDSSCDSCGWTLPGGVAQGSKFCSISCKFYPGQQLTHKSSNNTPLSGGAIFRNSSAQLCAVALDKYRKRPAAEGGRGGHGRKRARSEVRSDRSTCPRPETARAAPAQKNYLKEKKKGQQQEEYSKIIGLAAAAAAAAADCRAAAAAGLDANSHVCIRVHRRKGVPHRSPLF